LIWLLSFGQPDQPSLFNIQQYHVTNGQEGEKICYTSAVEIHYKKRNITFRTNNYDNEFVILGGEYHHTGVSRIFLVEAGQPDQLYIYFDKTTRDKRGDIVDRVFIVRPINMSGAKPKPINGMVLEASMNKICK
jgi:hypothetical protein